MLWYLVWHELDDRCIFMNVLWIKFFTLLRRRCCIKTRQLPQCNRGYWSIRTFSDNGSLESPGICTKGIYEGSERGGAESLRGRETSALVARGWRIEQLDIKANLIFVNYTYQGETISFRKNLYLIQSLDVRDFVLTLFLYRGFNWPRRLRRTQRCDWKPAR